MIAKIQYRNFAKILFFLIEIPYKFFYSRLLHQLAEFLGKDEKELKKQADKMKKSVSENSAAASDGADKAAAAKELAGLCMRSLKAARQARS